MHLFFNMHIHIESGNVSVLTSSWTFQRPALPESVFNLPFYDLLWGSVYSVCFRNFFSSSLTGDCLDPSQLMLMFPYWFMTAFSIIRMDWQVGSVCPDLPILLMAFDTYSALMDVWSIASLFPIWCPHRHRQRNVAHCPSSWDQPQAQCLLSGSQFPRLDIEDNERAFTRERRDTAGRLWGTPNAAFWYSSQGVPELSFCKLRSRYSLGAPKDGTETGKLGQDPWPGEEGKDEQIAKT